MSLICGVDPGLDGAIAFLDSTTLRIVAMIGMPTLKLGKGKGSKREISARTLVVDIEREVSAAGWHVSHVYLEKAHAGVWPSRRGVGGAAEKSLHGATAAFQFGRGYGLVEGVIAALGWPIEYVTPAKWKKALQVPAEKDDARARACQLLARDAEYWTPRRLVMNKQQASGRADAALLALYGVRALTIQAGGKLHLADAA